MRTFSVIALALLCAAPAAAQSDQDLTAYFALVGSPPGALPPALSSPMLGRAMTMPDFRIRYGHISTVGTDFNNFAATLGIPAGTKAMVGITAGYESLSCDGCDGHFMAGASAEGRLSSTMISSGADAAMLTIGLNGEFGYGHPSGASLYTLTAGLPVALVAGGSTLKIAPFLTPAIGWGRENDSGGFSDSGTRFLLGGGITFQSTTSAFGGNVGFQKVFINGGDTVFGISIIFGGR